MDQVDEVIERARSAEWSGGMPSAEWVRATGTRRKTTRRLAVGASVAVACALAAIALPFSRGLIADSTPVATGSDESLVFSREGADVPDSEVTGAFERTQDGCLLFGRDVAVIPPGSHLESNNVRIAGERPLEVSLGDTVTLGGAELSLSHVDVIDNLIDPETRAQFDNCTRASGSGSWVLVTTGS